MSQQRVYPCLWCNIPQIYETYTTKPWCNIGVYFVKEHHYYPISDERLKNIATKANQGGADNLWKYMSDMKWSRRHDQFAVLKSIDEEEELDVSNHDIVMPEDIKLELLV